MVKHYVENVNRQPINKVKQLEDKLAQLEGLRKRDFIRDQKRASLKNNTKYKKTRINLHQFIHHTSELNLGKISNQQKQVQLQVHSYKVAKQNTDFILGKLEQMGIKNQRPADYLVQMYKSDKQMIKVRKLITEKQVKVKEKMQGKDWMSKTKRRERAKKKSESKRQRRKSKLQARRPAKPKMDKVRGQKKIKK